MFVVTPEGVQTGYVEPNPEVCLQVEGVLARFSLPYTKNATGK